MNNALATGIAIFTNSDGKYYLKEQDPLRHVKKIVIVSAIIVIVVGLIIIAF